MINTNLPLKHFQTLFWDSIFLIFLGIFETSQPPAAFADGEKEPILLAGTPDLETRGVPIPGQKPEEKKAADPAAIASGSHLLVFVAKPAALLPATPEEKTPNSEKPPLSDNVSPKAQPPSGERRLPFIMSPTLRPFEETPDPEAGIPGPSPLIPPSPLPSRLISSTELGHQLYNTPRLILPEKNEKIPFLDVPEDSLLYRLVNTGLKYREGPIEFSDRLSVRIKLQGLRGGRISVKYKF